MHRSPGGETLAATGRAESGERIAKIAKIAGIARIEKPALSNWQLANQSFAKPDLLIANC
jgi:type III secretion system FlhB-like substrate exporter